MAEGTTPRGGVSALLRTTTASTNASDGGVGDSLEGLVSAVDELKRSMGMGEAVDLTAIEQFIARMRQENEEFRQYAEQAILSAQALKEERDDLAHQLEQLKLEKTMGAALAETQKLKDVADEFERDLYQQKLAEAEARVAEAEALRERITELEDENAGLNQTLKELRQTTRQLQSLQSHEVRRLQAVEKDAAAGRSAPRASSTGAPAAAAAEEAAAASSAVAASDGSYSPVAASTGSAPGSGRRSLSGSPRGAAPVAAPAAPAAEPSPAGKAAVQLAVQLEDVAGGADSGLLAEAAVALRELSKRDVELAASQQEATRLRSEVDELNDTMFSKTFKPPSAWAEREIKYKQEKKYWEEQQKELAARVAALAAERDALRGGSGAQQLEERIQELEAALVQSQRERDGARAQLHELQLIMRTEGEFGRAGKRLSPYKGPVGVDASEGREVAQMVGNIEHASATASPQAAPVGAGAVQRLHTAEAELVAARAEVASLQRQLSEQRAVQVPASVQGELGLGPVAAAAAVVAAAADIEARLKAAEQESEALRRRLGGDSAAAGGAAPAEEQHPASGGGSEHHGGDSAADAVAAAVAAEADMQVQELQARASGAEAAGDAEEAAALRQQAAALQALSQQARAAEEEAAALRVQLQELRPVQLQIAAITAAAAGGEAPADELARLPVPAALQGELGAEAPVAAIEAKAAELAERLADAQQEAGEARQQLKAAVAAEQALQAAAQQQQVLQAQLAVAEERGGAAAGESEEVEGLRRQLAAVQAQKEAAQKQLWQLTELQQQLQQSEAERRQLAAQLRAQQAQQAGAGEAAAEPAELAALRADLAEAQQTSAALRSELAVLRAAAASEAPVRLAMVLDGGSGHGGDAAAAERLAAAEAEAARLRAQLADLQPIRMQLLLREDAACLATPGSDLAALGPAGRGTRRSLESLSAGPLSPVAEAGAEGLAREGSASSMGAFSSEQARELSRERAAADAAWREHQKASDVPALLRAKAELETRCQMLETQIAKMQGELEKADATNAAFEDHLDSALQTGDVSVLSGLKESLSKGRHSLSKRFKKKGASPSKDTLKHTVHEMQDALTSSEEEKNALKRQLAKLSKKYQQVTQQQAHVAGIVEGAAAMQQQQAAVHSREASFSESPEVLLAHDDDSELELLKMREENQMLMEHVVMVKVRQAEMEGEYLEAKRQLLRTREKNLQLARKLADVREAAERGEPLPFTPRDGAPTHTATATATVTASNPGAAVSPLREGMAAANDAAGPTPKSSKRGLVGLGIAGL